MPLWGRLPGRAAAVRRRESPYERGIHLFNEGHYEAAIAEFQAALATVQRGTLDEQLSCFYLAESHSALAMAQIADPQAAVANETGGRAIQNLVEAIALNPTYPDLQYHLARAYFVEDRFDEALSATDRALALHPAFARATLLRGCVLFAQGRHEDGVREAVRAVLREPLLSRSAVRVAVNAHNAGDSDTALRLLRQSVFEEKGDPDDLALRALDLYRQERFDDAAETYRRAIELHPDYADLHNACGRALFAAGRFAEAARAFAQAVVINPRYVEAHLNRGLSLQKQGRRADAIDEFRTTLALEPENAAAREHLAALSVAPNAADTSPEEPTPS